MDFSKLSSVLLLCLLRIFMKQTLSFELPFQLWIELSRSELTMQFCKLRNVKGVDETPQ